MSTVTWNVFLLFAVLSVDDEWRGGVVHRSWWRCRVAPAAGAKECVRMLRRSTRSKHRHMEDDRIVVLWGAVGGWMRQGEDDVCAAARSTSSPALHCFLGCV